MYNTNFNMKRAKYVVFQKSNYYRYKNGVTTWNNQEYMESIYGICTYSFEDIFVFLENELITFFSQNNLRKKGIKDRKEELYQYYKNFKIYDLKEKKYFGEEYYNRNRYLSSFADLLTCKIFDIDYTYSMSTLIYMSKSYKLITKVAEWNEYSHRLNYSYPILKIDKEYSYWKRHYRPCFHNRDAPCNRYLRISKSEMIAGTDPEYSQYLSARQINRERTQNYSKWKKNRFQIPGDWKHYHKCRKQWAKNIENPSYEKLSKAVWKYELEEKENGYMDEKYCVVNDSSEILYEADTEDEARVWMEGNYEPDLQIIYG